MAESENVCFMLKQAVGSLGWGKTRGGTRV